MIAADRSGGDDVGRDSLGPEFLAQRLGQAPGAVLGHADMGAAVITVDRVHPGEVDDPAPAPFDHTPVGSYGPQHKKMTCLKHC